jgi:predicted nucleotidyltransferase component of viral defense system
VDFTQNIVLEPRKIDYNNHWGVNIIVNVMDMLEICAEKIRAMSGRARYRDFYDQYMILKNFDIRVSEVIDLVKIKEIRQTISPEHIQNNWEIAKQEKSYDNQRIYYKEVIQDSDIEKMLKSFTFKPIS